MRRLAVFASGSGTNFEAIVTACERGVLDAEVVLMVCDKPGAKVVERAAAHEVGAFVFAPKQYASKADYEREIVARLDAAGVELVCLAGYMRIVGDVLLGAYGGRIINCKTGETVFARSLPVSANKKIIGLAEENQVDIVTYEGSRIIASNPESPYTKLESRINGMEIWKPENMAEYVNFEVPKFLMMEDGDYLAMVEPKVKAAMGKNFSVYRSDPFFLEILPKGIDKAQSLERLLEVLGLTREQMIACGDGYNDLTMIKYAGLGVAMENAVLPVRNAADYITASNNDDGVGLVVEKFMLA